MRPKPSALLRCLRQGIEDMRRLGAQPPTARLLWGMTLAIVLVSIAIVVIGGVLLR